MPAPSSIERLSHISDLEVRIAGELVGRLAQPSRRSPVAFEYASSWLANGYSISPFSLPLEAGVSIAPAQRAGALHGIFDDSLPNDWGRLLVNGKGAGIEYDDLVEVGKSGGLAPRAARDLLDRVRAVVAEDLRG